MFTSDKFFHANKHVSCQSLVCVAGAWDIFVMQFNNIASSSSSFLPCYVCSSVVLVELVFGTGKKIVLVLVEIVLFSVLVN